jgi:hypothetical protein
MHGGKSTGPKTEEGKARVVAAMVEGRRKWADRMKAEGKKFPCGRKSGADWITPKMKGRATRAQEGQELSALFNSIQRGEIRKRNTLAAFEAELDGQQE